jgi:uncharacterized membrane protein
MASSPQNGKGQETTRAYFMRGLFFMVPIAITLWLVGFTLNLADAWLGTAIRALLSLLFPESSASLEAATWFGFVVSVTSVLALCGTLVALGKVASYRVGKEGLRLVDHLFIHIPGVNAVYRAARKMVEAFGDGGAGSFQRCVYLRFPGAYLTLGFVTKEVTEEGTGRKLLFVFVPQGPNPTGGFTQLVPADETYDAGMTPDQGLQLVVSMGVLAPDSLPQIGPKTGP